MSKPETMKEFSLVSNFRDPVEGIKEDKNPIIFLHAMLCSKETWGDILQTVANETGRRVYAYDARNHGESNHTADSNFKSNVRDLFSLMNLKGTDGKIMAPGKAILVGHDMGGITAISAALAEPSKFEKVIILEMFTKKVPESLIDRSKIFMRTWTNCVRQLTKDTPSADVTTVSVENLYEQLPDEMKEENEKLSYLNAFFVYKETEQGYDVLYNTEYIAKALDELKQQGGHQGKYDGPAYFFYGEKSHFNIGKEENAIKEHFPTAKFIKFEGGSHFLISDDPDKIAEEIGKSINEIS